MKRATVGCLSAFLAAAGLVLAQAEEAPKLSSRAKSFETCPGCHGTGWGACARCLGKGLIVQTDPQGRPRSVICETCRGSRTHLCKDCLGRTVIPGKLSGVDALNLRELADMAYMRKELAVQPVAKALREIERWTYQKALYAPSHRLVEYPAGLTFRSKLPTVPIPLDWKGESVEDAWRGLDLRERGNVVVCYAMEMAKVMAQVRLATNRREALLREGLEAIDARLADGQSLAVALQELAASNAVGAVAAAPAAYPGRWVRMTAVYRQEDLDMDASGFRYLNLESAEIPNIRAYVWTSKARDAMPALKDLMSAEGACLDFLARRYPFDAAYASVSALKPGVKTIWIGRLLIQPTEYPQTALEVWHAEPVPDPRLAVWTPMLSKSVSSYHFDRTPLGKALKIFADMTGVAIDIKDSAMTAVAVTATGPRQPLGLALDRILSAQRINWHPTEKGMEVGVKEVPADEAAILRDIIARLNADAMPPAPRTDPPTPPAPPQTPVAPAPDPKPVPTPTVVPPAPAPPAPPEELAPWVARAGRKISIESNDQPLSKVLRTVERLCGVPLELTASERGAATVNIAVRQMPLGAMLDRMLEPLGLTWAFTETGIAVKEKLTDEEAQRRAAVRPYLQGTAP